MIKEIYEKTRDTITAGTTIKAVKLWRAGMATEMDLLDKFPMVFLEFSNINYETMTGKVQECKGAQLVLHVLWKALTAEDTELFDISQDIYKAMQQAGFQRVSERPDYSTGEVVDWQIVFETPRIVDSDAVETMTKVSPPILVIKQV